MTLFLGLQAVVWWREWDLLRKLAAGASMVVVCGIAFVASVAAKHVREALLQRSAATTALYMDSIVAPHVQDLARTAALSDAKRKALGSLLAPTAIGRPIVGFRIWVGDRIIFSNDRMMGKRFPLSEARDRAWAGVVSPELDSLDGDEDVDMLVFHVPLLEIYAPVRQTGTGQIIALVETYEIAEELAWEIRGAQALVWAVSGVAALGVMVLLFGVAGFGARELSRIDRYRARISIANRRIHDINELYMRRVGEDLRDGPMRQVGLVLLKLDTLRGQPPADDVDAIGSALNQTLIQMRSLTASLLPSRIWRLSLQDTIATAARRHERRTGVPVTCRFGPLLSNVPISVKACLYRFVQDGLNYCCISCDSCMVRMSSKSGEIEVEIIPSGSAMPWPPPRAEHEQALRDLRDRVETLGGTFLVQGHSNFRSVVARLKLEETNPADD